MKIMFEARLKAGIKHDKKNKIYITYAPALRLYSQGENMIQAKSALEDAIQSFLIVAYRKGVLDKCLKNAGFCVDVPSRGEQCEGQEFISVKEEVILEQQKFEDVFEIPAHLSLSMVTA